MSAAAEDQRRWQVCVRAGEDWRTAAMQVLDPMDVTTIVLWGTPEDDDQGVVLDVNVHTNVDTGGDRQRLGDALALYLEAVVHALRATPVADDDEAPTVVAGSLMSFTSANDA